jgi:hypothetical protein
MPARAQHATLRNYNRTTRGSTTQHRTTQDSTT